MTIGALMLMLLVGFGVFVILLLLRVTLLFLSSSITVCVVYIGILVAFLYYLELTSALVLYQSCARTSIKSGTGFYDGGSYRILSVLHFLLSVVLPVSILRWPPCFRFI